MGRRSRNLSQRDAVVAIVVGVLMAAIAGQTAHVHAPAAAARTTAAVRSPGTLDCSQLEALWESAGGSPAAAFMAAEIATAESGGQHDASSPAGDVGYWQINEPIWGPALATTDPLGNAKAAIHISHDGTDWSPWVTFETGAYQGKC